MQFTSISNHCYYFQGPVNIGYVQSGEIGMIIDAGIDTSVMKKVLKELDEKSLPVTHLFITHAHADHYGGASYLQQNRTVYTFAPAFEEAILRNPMLEPLYLFGGNDPVPELRNKFLEGKPIFIDEVLHEGTYEREGIQFQTFLFPGHSYYQLGLLFNGILYAGDAYFGEEQLHKHKIPYLTDADAAIQSLYKIKQIECLGALPGHGVFEKEFHSSVDGNIAYHHELLHMLKKFIEQHSEGVSHEDVVAYMCEVYQVNAPKLAQWLLFRTAVTGYLVALVKQEEVTYEIKNYRWWLHTNNKSSDLGRDL